MGFREVAYSWGGVVTTFVMVYHTLKEHVIDWPFVFIFVGFLAYHLGPHMFEKFLETLKKP